MSATVSMSKMHALKESKLYDRKDAQQRETQSLMETIRRKSTSPSPLREYKKYLEKSSSPWKSNKQFTY